MGPGIIEGCRPASKDLRNRAADGDVAADESARLIAEVDRDAFDRMQTTFNRSKRQRNETQRRVHRYGPPHVSVNNGQFG